MVVINDFPKMPLLAYLFYKHFTFQKYIGPTLLTLLLNSKVIARNCSYTQNVPMKQTMYNNVFIKEYVIGLTCITSLSLRDQQPHNTIRQVIFILYLFIFYSLYSNILFYFLFYTLFQEALQSPGLLVSGHYVNIC